MGQQAVYPQPRWQRDHAVLCAAQLSLRLQGTGSLSTGGGGNVFTHVDVGIYTACTRPHILYACVQYLPAVTPHCRPDSWRPGFLETPTLTAASGWLSQRTGPGGQVASCILQVPAQQPIPEPLADGPSAPTRRSVHT